MAIKAVVSLSGGLDSTVMVRDLIHKKLYRPDEIMAVHFQYGSTHNAWEIEAAEKVRQWLGIPWATNSKVIDLTPVFAAIGCRSALMLKSDAPIPEGHYNDASMSQTVVPGRNLIFASILASIAESETMKLPDQEKPRSVVVYLGVHQGDHHIYPDCRPAFVASANDVVHYSSNYLVGVYAPFRHLTKADIVKIGLENDAPFGLTRTCYKNQPVACGKCGSCRERLEAFQINGVQDFIEYTNEVSN